MHGKAYEASENLANVFLIIDDTKVQKSRTEHDICLLEVCEHTQKVEVRLILKYGIENYSFWSCT